MTAKSSQTSQSSQKKEACATFFSVLAKKMAAKCLAPTAILAGFYYPMQLATIPPPKAPSRSVTTYLIISRTIFAMLFFESSIGFEI